MLLIYFLYSFVIWKILPISSADTIDLSESLPDTYLSTRHSIFLPMVCSRLYTITEQNVDNLENTVSCENSFSTNGGFIDEIHHGSL